MSKTLVALACCLVLGVAACDQVVSREPDFSRGGSYLLMQVDHNALREDRLESLSDDMANALRSASIDYNGRGVLGDAARVQLSDPADGARALQALSAMPSAASVQFSAVEGFIEARLSEAAVAALLTAAVDESIAVLGRRMDSLPPVEIARAGADLLRIRMPAGVNVEVVRARAAPTAKLTFHLVREVSPEDAAAGVLPSGTMLAPPFPNVGDQTEVIERRPRLSGDMIERASPASDQFTGEFVLSFQLNAEGARRFCRITTEHTNERFAILLDGQVLTAPRINEPICGGSGQISGNFTAETASDLAAMLNAGALPAPLIVMEEGAIAPLE